MNTITKHMIVGTLASIGIATSASAGEIVWGNEDHSIRLSSQGVISANSLNGIDYTVNGEWNQRESIGTAAGTRFGESIGDSFGMSIAADSGHDENRIGAVLDSGTTFTVLHDSIATVAWNFSGDTAAFSAFFNPSHFFIDHVRDNNLGIDNLFSASRTTTPGTIEIELFAGQTYSYSASAWSYGLNGDSFASFTVASIVPLPSAAFAGLGMLAGLGAYRRIRR